MHLRVLVRWHGGWVSIDKLREALIALLDAMSAQGRKLTGDAEDDRTDRLAEALSGARGRSGVSRLLRQRLNNVGDDIERTMFAFAALGTDGQLEWENHDPENPTEPLLSVVERALGIDRARGDDIGGEGPLMREQESSQDILEELQQAGTFKFLDLGSAFRDATDSAIEEAFDDAIACAGLVKVFEAVQVIAGNDVAGLASFTEAWRSDDALQRALLVRGLLLMRPLMEEGALDSVVQAARDAGPQLQAASEICRAFPQYAAFLGPRGPEELDKLPAADRERIVAEIRTYVDSRPALQKALDQPQADASA